MWWIKKGWIALFGISLLLMSACSKTNFQEVEVSMQEVETMFENKESFQILVERDNCPFCESLNQYIEDTKQGHALTVYKLDTTDFEFSKRKQEDEVLQSGTEEGQKFLEKFPYFLYTPTIYTIQDGVVRSAAIGFNEENKTMSEWNVDSSIDWDKADEVDVWKYLER